MIIFDRSVRSLIQQVQTVLDTGNVDRALRLVHNFVDQIVAEPICTAQVFASHGLDNICLAIGRRNLASLMGLRNNHQAEIANSKNIIYLVSRLQRSGGHSRLVQDFIRSQPEKNHIILSTEIGGPSDDDFYSRLFSGQQNVSFVQAPYGDFAMRLNWLQSILLSSQFEHVYLFNHHQDSVAVAAIVPELGLKGSFIHHGDHHLCLGVHLKHLTHIDLHPMGYHYCRDFLGVYNQYLPLTCEDKQCVLLQTEFVNGGSLTTATAAGYNKIEIPYYISYLDVIPCILKATGGRHVHIGKLTPWGLRRIYRNMRKLGVQKSRFIYIEWTSSVWQALQSQQVDVYIASFPYGAGLTLIEAMGAGVPVIVHEHMFSRVLSGIELAYAEAYRWSEPENLLLHLTNLRPERLEREKQLSRQQYERFHLPKILEAYLRKSEAFPLKTPELSKNFSPRLDDWASCIASEVNFRYLAFKYLKRFAKKLRSIFH